MFLPFRHPQCAEQVWVLGIYKLLYRVEGVLIMIHIDFGGIERHRNFFVASSVYSLL